MAKKPAKPADDDAGFFGAADLSPPSRSAPPPKPEPVVRAADTAHAAKGAAGEKKPRARAPRAPVVEELNTERPASIPVLYPPPIPLSSLIGQQRAIDTIRRAIASERVHHAWIFHGPPGVGKFTAALAFASIILDPTSAANFGGDVEPDPDSRTQALLRAGAHPDLNVVVKELARFSRDDKVRANKLTNIPNEVVKEFFVEPATRTGQVSGGARAGKVFIIDEAELLDPTAQNTILKTLEEPAPGTVLILVTSAEHLLLATTRSRCQRVGFVSLDDASMRSWLKRSGQEIPPAELTWLLAFAHGSPGRFLKARQGGFYDWHLTLAPMLETSLQGRFVPELGATMHQMVEKWAKANVDESDEAGVNASKQAANRVGMEEMFRLVADFITRALHASAMGAACSMRLDPEAAASAIDAVREAEARADANVNMQFVFEGLAADMAMIFAAAR